MKPVQTAAPGAIEVAEINRPVPGPRDVLMRVRACGICGTDAAFVQMGGMPLGPGGQTAAIPLGHEPAGELVAVGAAVADLKAGDRVVVNPQAAPSGIIGCGGALGGTSEYLLIENAVAGKSIAIFHGTPSLRGRCAQRADGGRPALREPVRSPRRRQGGRLRRRRGPRPIRGRGRRARRTARYRAPGHPAGSWP